MKYYDIKEKPFKIYGLYEPLSGNGFIRMPKEIADSVSEPVSNLSKNTAGGRVRFKTNSEHIGIKVKLGSELNVSCMSPAGIFGFDAYSGEKYLGTFLPPYYEKNSYESEITIYDNDLRDVTINFPLYMSIESVNIGLDDDAVIKSPESYSIKKPVIFYGSSITQGAAASRPGLCYESILSRRFDFDFINLGFAGNAKGEKNMAEYIASLDFSVFVLDYDHNAPDDIHLKNTHYNFYKTIRDKHPLEPIILMSKPDYVIGDEQQRLRRCMVMETYTSAVRNGDKNIYFIDGAMIFANSLHADCTVDGVHPNDRGMYLMSESLSYVMRHIFTK
jgi:hypothetical protein